MKETIPASSLILVLLLSVLSTDAHAFTRSRDPDTKACLWWKHRLVKVVLNNACSQDVPVNNCANAVWTTLDVWNNPTCSDFRFVSGGTTSRTDVGFDQDNWDDNINLIIWQNDNWPHDDSAIALTTSTYDRLTGEVVDTDVEFNGVNFTFSTAESPDVIVDISNTLAHEAGHMLGLDHSSDTSASMYAYAPEGETQKRNLSQDDIDGLCHVYPAGLDLPPCEGFIPPDNTDNGGGCGCTTKGQTLPSWFGWLIVLAFGFIDSRRRG